MNYTDVSPEFTTKFFELVDQAKNIVVTAHKTPDSDSIASVLSVYEILSIKYPDKALRMLYTGEPEEKYKIFKGFDKIEWVSDLTDETKETDLLIVLDGSQFSRFTFKPEELKQIKKTICIDHHSSPIDEFTLSLVAPKYPANAEVIYRSLCNDLEVSKELAEIFLLGILGDTGNFSYLKPNQTETLTVAKELLEISKIEIQEFQSRYQTISLRKFGILKELIKNTSYEEIVGWPNIQYSFISREFAETGGYTDNEIYDTSLLYMAHYLRIIEGYPWGVVVTPKKNGDCYISLRSLPNNVSVRDLMERMKLGGGHDRAAGGTYKKEEKDADPQESINKILGWVSENKPLIV